MRHFYELSCSHEFTKDGEFFVKDFTLFKFNISNSFKTYLEFTFKLFGLNVTYSKTLKQKPEISVSIGSFVLFWNLKKAHWFRPMWKMAEIKGD